MTWTLSVISANTEYNLSDNQDYLLTGIDGIGAAPVVRISERGPMQHGESDLGYRLQPRNIILAVMAKGGDEAAWFARRNTLMTIFRSSDSPLKLRITSGEMVRQIDCYLNGTMEMTPEVGLVPGWQRVGIELYAPDPTWYDPDGASHVFMLGGGQAMNVPLAVPWQVGASAIDQSIVVAYAGSWDAYPTILIDGPVTGLLVQNNTLGDKLDFTGVTIPAGETYVIDCRYGYKTVIRQSDGANRIQDLTADSNLATFRVGAHPEPLDGVNSLRVKGTGITAGTRVVIQYKPRYVGV